MARIERGSDIRYAGKVIGTIGIHNAAYDTPIFTLEPKPGVTITVDPKKGKKS